MDKFTAFCLGLYTIDPEFPLQMSDNEPHLRKLQRPGKSCLNMKHEATGAEFSLCVHHTNHRVPSIRDQTET